MDDNPDVGDSLALRVEVAGHEFALAQRATRGFAAAKAFKPDLAFLDIGMPGMNGYELARAVETSPESMVLRHSHPKKRTSGVPKCFPRTKTIDQGTLRRLIDAGAKVHAEVFGGAS